MKDSRHNTPLITAVVFLLAGALLFCSRASEEGAANQSEVVGAGLRFEAFAPILNNNVFNAHRQDSDRLDAERERDQQRSIPVDRFALVGTMHNEDQSFAFFTGTEPAFRSVIQVGQKIAGHTVVSIRNKAVTLSKGENSFEFAIGMEMSRQGETEEWKLNQKADGRWRTSDSGKLESSDKREQEKPDALTGNKADILKQMIQRRQKEIDK